MKHFTLMMTALVAGMWVQQSHAQTFVKEDPFTSLNKLHRLSPTTGDVNNDGRIDIYHGGENWYEGMAWQCQGYLWLGQGNGTYKGLVSNVYTEDHYNNDSTKLVVTAGVNEDGTFNALGLPPSVYNVCRYLDYNNDGNIDMFFDSGTNDDLGNIAYGNGQRFVLLMKNGGAANGYKFEITNPNTFPCGGSQNSGNEHGDRGNNQSVALGDYDKDGYTDILIQTYRKYVDEEGNEKGGRYVGLFHNNGDGTFSEANVFTPLPYDTNPHFNGGIFDIDEETFEAVPKKNILPMSHGAVAFGDLNNDGWLDVMTAGYCDGENTGGGAFIIYKNNGDGTFDEVDLKDQPIRGTWESELAIADFNNDGWLDIAHFGTGSFEGKAADIYYNNGALAPFTFTASTVESGNGLYGMSEGNVRAFDVNNDGRIDIVGSGWSNIPGNWGMWVFIQNADNTFSVDEGAGIPEAGGGFSIGDLYERNVIDVVQFGYTWENESWDCHGGIYKNTNGENSLPSTAYNVQASVDGNMLTVTWDAAEDSETDAAGLAYNVYVRNNATGEISMIMPADPETGRIKAYEQYSALVRSDDAYQYQVKVKEGGDYTIGVQAVDPSLAGGPFATTNIKIETTGVKAPRTAAQAAKMTVKDGGVYVECTEALAVSIYNAAGEQVAAGTTNTLIPVSAHGVFIVKVQDQNIKIVM